METTLTKQKINKFSSEQEELNLHLGCGDIYLVPNYINIDIQGELASEVSKEELKANESCLGNYFKYPFGMPRRKIIVDKKMNLLHPWDFKDDSVDKIVAISIIEHFTKKEGQWIISEIKRVLKNNGNIIIDVPDIKEQIKQYYESNPEWCMDLIYCNGTTPYSFHRYGYTDKTFRILWGNGYIVYNKIIVRHNYPMLQYEIIKNI